MNHWSSAELAQLFLRHGEELRRYLGHQLGCPDTAADLSQDIYVRLGRSERPQQLGNVRAYLFRMARNLLIDHRRRQRASPVASDAELPLDAPCPQPPPERVAADGERLAVLRAALAELPPHLRDALLWNRLEGLSQRVIAERLGVSESMVGRYIVKALECCEGRLAQAEDGAG